MGVIMTNELYHKCAHRSCEEMLENIVKCPIS